MIKDSKKVKPHLEINYIVQKNVGEGDSLGLNGIQLKWIIGSAL